MFIFGNYRPKKDEPYQTRLVARCNLISFQVNISTVTASIPTAKLLFNNTISTKGPRVLLYDIKNYSRDTSMDRYKYIRIALNITLKVNHWRI